MKVLGLDISKHTGYAVVEDGVRVESGTFEVDAESLGFSGLDSESRPIVDEYGYMAEAIALANKVYSWYLRHEPDWIYIEQTNNGRNRTSQKNLEFLHYEVLRLLGDHGLGYKVRYVDTSAWKSHLKIRMNKDQRKHNKMVKEKKARGKITSKHLTVAAANKTFNLNLLLKDNNEADALMISLYGISHAKEELRGHQVPQPDLGIREAFKAP